MKLLLKLTLYSILLLGYAISNTLQAQTQQEEKSENTVYVTKTGTKYHKGRCSYLKYSKITKNKSDAIKQGYTACSRCSGGSSSSSSKNSSGGRCTATTKAGTRCKRNAESGRIKCWQH